MIETIRRAPSSYLITHHSSLSERVSDESLARATLPARRDLGRRGRQLRALHGARDGGRAVPVRRAPTPARESARVRIDRAHRPRLARLPAGGAAGPALRLPRPRAVRAAGRAPLQPAQAAARSLREGDRGHDRAGTTRCSATASAIDDGGPVARRARQRAVRAEVRRRRPAPSPGATTRRRDTPWHKTRHLRAARRRASRSCHPEVPEELRGTYAGLAHRPVDRVPASARRHGGRAAAGAPVRRRPAISSTAG